MKKTISSIPYLLWMIMFIVLPIFVILYYSFTKQAGGEVAFTLEHMERAFRPEVLKVMWKSVYFAFLCTLACVILGYPLALIVANMNPKYRNLIIMLFVLPMWMNFLIRTYAWLTIFEDTGLINTFLSKIGLPRIQFLYNDFAVVMGMLYNFLPFMILPIYSVLVKIDKKVIEAAQDLGANNFKVFTTIILPLSIPGVISGITMVFMPAVTTFVVPQLLGAGKTTLIGNMIERQFLHVYDPNFGSALSVFLLVLILITMSILNLVDKNKESTGGGFI